MHTETVRVYYQSLWFWLQRILSIALPALFCVCASQSRHGGIIVSLFLAAVTLTMIYAGFCIEPLAVEIHPDFFTLRFFWRRQNYPFADVNYITRDQVQLPRAGTMPTVRVGFRSRHCVQLKFPGTREKLYHALIAAWHTATDDPPARRFQPSA